MVTPNDLNRKSVAAKVKNLPMPKAERKQRADKRRSTYQQFWNEQATAAHNALDAAKHAQNITELGHIVISWYGRCPDNPQQTAETRLAWAIKVTSTRQRHDLVGDTLATVTIATQRAVREAFVSLTGRTPNFPNV